ncbi:Retrovirus-related Pol polyprotein from transposon RE2 [Vitis vinifera]|uniref:Retrovirus-related Pol polyprotein from transposon RE2 n=1 Tax=Vitis vinifera TaxID=29760 RepID=A0A438J1A3_VITVI|nr:Retrovirus-related Pol polyprotein from transposon RE2 [Vitis vinifera]
MKDTASSCMVVATLIATVMFAAAFSVPGGNDDDTGRPIFLTKKSFLVFAISDALALFSSATSILIFLSILTSRYAEEDFLESLPNRLIIGLATLFISVATMMIAFCATLFIVLGPELVWVANPMALVACVPSQGRKPNSFLFPVSSTPGNLPVTVFLSGHLPISQLSGTGTKEDPRAPRHAHFHGRRVRRFSGDAPPPPASPAADQHPYLPGSPIRALHVPLLGIFVSVSPPNSLSGEVPATFSTPIPARALGSVLLPFWCENYLSWSASVELWFMGQGYEDHLVTQEADIPEAYKTCFKFWTQAKGLYTNDIQRLYKVASAIVHLSQQDLDLSTYIGQIASLKEQFLTVMPLTPDVGAQQTQLDKFFMVLTLIGLRPDLEPIRDQILGSSSVPSLDDVFARLLRISSTQTLPSDSASDSSVLVSQTTSRGGRSGTRGRGQRPHCTYCNKLGHTRDRCYQLHGRPPRTAHMAQSSDSPLPQPPSSSASQTSQASIASVAQPGNASACLTHTSSLGPWILDSGASDHLSGNKDLFSSITTTSDLPTVTLANGSQTVAKGIGLALPLPSLPLTSVLYTPECPFNLISISKITRTLNCSITFSDKFVTLQDRSTGKTIGIGRESQGLYHLTSDSSPAVCISTDAPLLIHNRLGHPSLSKFQKMVPRFSTLSSLPCESCQLGKHTRVSFPKRLNNRAKSPFELVHTDVWGPCRTASTLGFQYFVTFIDDYSRCTWLFLMKNRAELFSIFQKFYTEIQTQFNISIRVLRSDNAREYFSAQFTSFMSHHGILHQSSCAHTPQQNGVAERKNRHLVETARTLLLHSHVPFRFWGDAVLTACYLINRMPSSVLHDQIPHSLLFPDQPLYFLPPRVFGCTCFVHILTPGQDKLSAKAMKCLFLGYSRLQKGYRCYSLETHRYFISADVTFFEDSPFFSTTSESLPVSEVLPIPIVSPPDAMPPRPLQVYHRRPRVVAPLPFLRHLLTHFLSLRLHLPRLCLLLMTYPLLFGKAGDRQWWMKWLLCTLMALGNLVVLPSGKSTVGCRWVYAVKVGPDGQVDRLKARLVAKGYTQVYGSDYGDTFSPVAKIASVRLLLSMAAMCSWPLYQLDIKNAFLHGDLARKFIWSNLLCIYLVVYVDDIVITGSDQDGIQKLKQHLFTHFQTKDLGKLKYFLGIEIAQSSSGVVLSQRKTGEPLGDPGRYRRLVGKLNYLTITRPDISFPVSVVSQFLQSPCDSHWDAVIRILRYIKSTPGQGVLYENRGHTQVVGYTDADWAGSPTDRRSTSGYCVFIGGNLISWKSKKQDVVARSSAEAEYRAMALATCELIWLRHLLQELRFGKDEQMKLICDNQAALHIASNPVFHERTKHIEVDCHFIREKIASGCVATSFVNSNDQLADIFTKSLRGRAASNYVKGQMLWMLMIRLFKGKLCFFIYDVCFLSTTYLWPKSIVAHNFIQVIVEVPCKVRSQMGLGQCKKCYCKPTFDQAKYVCANSNFIEEKVNMLISSKLKENHNSIYSGRASNILPMFLHNTLISGFIAAERELPVTDGVLPAFQGRGVGLYTMAADSSSVDVILDFLRRNRFTRAEAALRSELGNRPDLNGFLQKLTLEEKADSGNVAGVEAANGDGSQAQGSGSKELVIVKEIECGERNKPPSGDATNMRSDKNFAFSKGSEDTVLDLYTWKFNADPYRNEGGSSGVSTKNNSNSNSVLELQVYEQSRYRIGELSDAVASKDAKSGEEEIGFSGEKRGSWVGSSSEKDGKRKAEMGGIRAAIKEQVDEVGRALYFGKSQGSSELKTISSLNFPLVLECQKEELPRLPPVKLKSEEKPLNISWEEKFEHEGCISNGDAYVVVGGKRTAGGSWLSVSQGIAEDTSDLVSGFATVGDGLSESIDYPNEYWDSDEYDDDDDVGYMRQPIEDETWFLAHEIDYPSDNEKGTGHGSVPDPQERGPTKDEDDDQSFAEEDSYFSGEQYFPAKHVAPVSASDDPIGLSVTEMDLSLRQMNLSMLRDGKVMNDCGRPRLDDNCMDDDQHGSVRSIGVGINSDAADIGSEVKNHPDGGFSFPPPLRDGQLVQASSSKSLWSNNCNAPTSDETDDCLNALMRNADMLASWRRKSSDSSPVKSSKDEIMLMLLDQRTLLPSTLSNYGYNERGHVKKEEDEKTGGAREEDPGVSLEDEEAAAVQEQVRQIKAQEEEFETFNLKIVHRKNRHVSPHLKNLLNY